jgi:hypothetical protein
MRRRGLNRIGILAIALILALGAVGIAYGTWVDEIYITGSLSTSSVEAGLDCGTFWEDPDTPETGIICLSGDGPMALNIEVDNATEEVDYYCNFIVTNTSSSLPIKITNMNLSGSYSGVFQAIEFLSVGDVIDPLDSATGRVHIYLTNADSAGEDLTYTLTVTVARWNK